MRWNELVAFVAWLARILEVARVFDGDFLASTGNGTSALLINCLGDTHSRWPCVSELAEVPGFDDLTGLGGSEV